jgi:putative ABC transport system permease protein
MGGQIEAFKREALAIPGIERITNSEQVPGRPFSTALFRAGDDPELVEMAYTYTGFDFVETYGLDLVEGRSLSRGRAEDSLGVILNETAVARLGLADPIGKQVVWPDEATYTVLGVVRDFHVASLHHEIAPVALLGPDPRNQNRPNLLLSARIGSFGVPETLVALGDAWSTFAPAQPFVYRFVDADFEALYRRDRISGRLFGGFAAMAILLACIGLLGLTAYTSELRTKEIGIRKVLGASVSEIVVLLSKDYLRLVAIAFIVALPAAYVLADLWLRDFILRVDTGFMPFLAAGVLAALLAIAMIGFHAARSALRDPVESLRSE